MGKAAKKKNLRFMAAMAVLLAFAFFYFYFQKEEMAVIHPVRGQAVQAVYATGVVEPTVMVPLAPRAAGRLTALLAEEGDQVEKGQALATLENQDMQAKLLQLQARADLAEKEYNRRSVLVTQDAVSIRELDQARADLEAVMAAVREVEAELDFLILTAPETSTIIRRDGEAGEIIAAGEPVFWLSGGGGLRIEAGVDEEDIALVQPGQRVAIRADAFPKDIFFGRVDRITPKGDPVSRSYRVRVSLEPDTPLMIGMTVENNIIIREDKNALLIPSSAITNDGKVFLIEENTVRPVEVQVGARTSQVVEVLQGLQENSLILFDATKAAPGEKIRTSIREWEAP